MQKSEKQYVPIVRLYAVRESTIPYGKEHLTEPRVVAEFVRKMLGGADREILLAISVDTKSRPVGMEVAAIGSLNVIYASPRELFKHALLSNSSGIILVHNHPSGEAVPSEDDLRFTKRMKKAGELLGVEVLDHIIIGEGDTFTALSESPEWQAA